MPSNSSRGDSRTDSADSDDPIGATTKRRQTHVTRRTALASVGSALAFSTTETVAGATETVDPSAEVYQNASGEYVAENYDYDFVAYEGGDFIAAIQAAFDSLTDGRDRKEKVVISANGETGPHEWDGDLKYAWIPSYTIIEITGNIHVNDSRDPLIVPLQADQAHDIDFPEVSITGNPRYAIRLRSVSNVWLGNVDLRIPGTPGDGIRIDREPGPRSEDLWIDCAYVEGCGHHAVETYGVDNFNASTIETVDTGGCGLLLNDTTDATVDTVDATRADPDAGYAAFRCANDCGPGVTLEHLRADNCGRGFFSVSGSEGITVNDVYIQNCNTGIFIQDTQDVTVDGGTVRDSAYNGVFLDSSYDSDHHNTTHATVRNLRVVNTDSGPDQTNGINDYDSQNQNIHISHCDVRNGGTDNDMTTTTDSIEIEGCRTTDVAPGRYVLWNANSDKVLEVRDRATGNAADVVQWEKNGGTNQQWDLEDTGGGIYRLINVNSDKVLEVADASTHDGANVRQWSDSDLENKRWYVRDEGDGRYSLEAVHSGKVADVEGGSKYDGATVLQWSANGGDNQHWFFEAV